MYFKVILVFSGAVCIYAQSKYDYIFLLLLRLLALILKTKEAYIQVYL